jgi:Xaa-Pro aminopeptidase
MTPAVPTPPFDVGKLDALMTDAGIDVLLASSKHNTRYLLGGHYSRFFRHFDAVGTSRYLPVVGYVSGKLDHCFYIGSPLESSECEVSPIWPPFVSFSEFRSDGSARLAAECVRERAAPRPNVAVESAFIPADAMEILVGSLPGATFREASPILDELRAVKTPRELELIRIASMGVVESMMATFDAGRSGGSKIELDRCYRCEIAGRGLTYEYSLITAGTEMNRALSSTTWEEGEILSLDSGAEYEGYLGDLCRMAVRGKPTERMEEVLAQAEALQDAARRLIRAGETGQALYESAQQELEQLPDKDLSEFLIHGVGLVSHEAPRLTSTTPIQYAGTDAQRPLEAGMVLSIESQVVDPAVGFVKLEDTVIVTIDGFEIPADVGREWNVAGSAVAATKNAQSAVNETVA